MALGPLAHRHAHLFMYPPGCLWTIAETVNLAKPPLFTLCPFFRTSKCAVSDLGTYLQPLGKVRFTTEEPASSVDLISSLLKKPYFPGPSLQYKH